MSAHRSVLPSGSSETTHTQQKRYPNTKHGHKPRNGSPSPTYNSWRAMQERCNNPNARGYKWYGKRGISVCPRWESFENFLVDMGEKPKGLTLDRTDNDGNYEPGNCQWVTQKEQTRGNRRDKQTVEVVTHEG